MPISITMPRLSDTMEAGTIIKWNVKEGDKVASGDVIADIETDKATMEMQVYDDGTIASLNVPEGQKANVGTVIAVLAADGEDAKSASQAAPAAKEQPRSAPAASSSSGKTSEKKPVAQEQSPRAPAAAATRSTAAPADPEEEAQVEAAETDPVQGDGKPRGDGGSGKGSGRIFVSPMARRLAEENHLELRNIEGSGPGGRIIKRDILKAVGAAKETSAAVPPAAKAQPQSQTPGMAPGVTAEVVDRPAKAVEGGGLATRVPSGRPAAAPAAMTGFSGIPTLESQIVPLSNMRQIIAKRLVESKTTIPHYQVTATFNMDPLLDLRATLNEQLAQGSQDVKLSVNDFIVRCCALAMHQHPEFNASWGGDHIEINGHVNVGIAISLPPERGGGLVVGCIRDADQKGLRQISMESKMLADKARTRGLTIQEMSDTTFTISNLGMFGVDNFTAIINPPNSAILAVGAALEKPVVRNHQLTVGHEMNATLSLDHRVIDGAMGARYLQTLKQLIENPGTLLV